MGEGLLSVEVNDAKDFQTNESYSPLFYIFVNKCNNLSRFFLYRAKFFMSDFFNSIVINTQST